MQESILAGISGRCCCAMEQGSVAAMQGAIRLESSLAELSVIPGVDPRRCLKGPLLPKGISNLRVMDILNLFLEGVVEQLQKPEDVLASVATTANGTPCTAPSLASSSGRSSTRSNLSASSAKAKPRAARSASPPLPGPSSRPGTAAPGASAVPAAELRKLRQKAAQCQEFKEMSDRANSELVRMEAEVQRLREQVSRLSRQNKQLLLQLRQQRFQHQQELRLCRDGAEERGEDVNLLTYLKEAPEQNDGQLQKDLQSHSADVRTCLKKVLRHALLEQFGQPFDLEERATIATPMDGLSIHVRQLWSMLHGLWRSDTLETVEDFFEGRCTAEDVEWPEVAENAEKQALQMLERLSSATSSSPSCDSRAKPYHVPEPRSAGSDDREGNSSAALAPLQEVSESPITQKRRRSRQGSEQHAAGDRLPSTPSFGSPWRHMTRSPSPSEPQRTAVQRAPNMPAVLMAGPVLSRAARPRAPAPAPAPGAPAAVPASEMSKPRRTSPDQSLSPRVPTKRNEVRPRSLSPEMAKRLQKTAFR